MVSMGLEFEVGIVRDPDSYPLLGGVCYLWSIPRVWGRSGCSLCVGWRNLTLLFAHLLMHGDSVQSSSWFLQ